MTQDKHIPGPSNYKQIGVTSIVQGFFEVQVPYLSFSQACCTRSTSPTQSFVAYCTSLPEFLDFTHFWEDHLVVNQKFAPFLADLLNP